MGVAVSNQGSLTQSFLCLGSIIVRFPVTSTILMDHEGDIDYACYGQLLTRTDIQIF